MSRSHKLIYSFLTVITLFLTCPVHAYYTYVVGDLYTADSVRHNYGPQADATYTKQRIMGKTVAYHSESGLRELVVYDWGGMDTGEGWGACLLHRKRIL